MNIDKNDAYFIYGVIKGLCQKNGWDINDFPIIGKIENAFPDVKKDLSPESLIKLLNTKIYSGDIIKGITGLFLNPKSKPGA